MPVRSSSLNRSSSTLRESTSQSPANCQEMVLRFNSQGFQRFFAMIATELDEEYLHCVEEQIERLEFNNGVLMSAGLGIDCKGNNFVLRETPETKQGWLERVQEWVAGLTGKADATFVYEVDERDETGFRILGDLRTQGILHVATCAYAVNGSHSELFQNSPDRIRLLRRLLESA